MTRRRANLIVRRAACAALAVGVAGCGGRAGEPAEPVEPVDDAEVAGPTRSAEPVDVAPAPRPRAKPTTRYTTETPIVLPAGAATARPIERGRPPLFLQLGGGGVVRVTRESDGAVVAETPGRGGDLVAVTAAGVVVAGRRAADAPLDARETYAVYLLTGGENVARQTVVVPVDPGAGDSQEDSQEEVSE